MTVLKVLKYGNPVLREKSYPIDYNAPQMEDYCEAMIDTMYEMDGIGLAAPQVGINRRVIVLDVDDLDEDIVYEDFTMDRESYEIDFPLVLINPEIYKTEGEDVFPNDGCLSIPGLSPLKTKRIKKISVKAMSIDGEELRIIGAEGILNVCLQHEIDHLNGVLFVDRLVDDTLDESKILAAIEKQENSPEYQEKINKLNPVDGKELFKGLIK